MFKLFIAGGVIVSLFSDGGTAILIYAAFCLLVAVLRFALVKQPFRG